MPTVKQAAVTIALAMVAIAIANFLESKGLPGPNSIGA